MSDAKTSIGKLVLAAIAPLALLALAALWMINSDPLRMFSSSAPPVEELTFERMILDSDGIHLQIRAAGSEPMNIAQIQVDDAYWKFSQTPPGPIPRLSTAWLDIYFPWVEGDAHLINLVTSSGTTFEHEIGVAIATPTSRTGSLRAQTILGGFVGILPIVIGLMFFPLLRQLGRGGMRFIMALTLGMLAYLFIETLGEALEFAHQAAAAFQGTAMVLLIAIITCGGLIAVGRKNGTPTGMALATFIALGIGLHNLGEGLAISAALAAGSAGLGAFLIMGFTIHNVTEGIAIAAPLLKSGRPPIIHLIGLAVLAGAPAILGIWLGSYAIAPHWAALALAIGTGAIAQVLFEVGSYTLRLERGTGFALDRYTLAGFIGGAGFMYFTAMAIKI